ncbi:MAG: STAS domain-containing protein [Spirochaetia bacterium]|nr:STAS domain-containing protein [Spirochaetia bacterium]
MEIEVKKTGDVCLISLKGDLNIYNTPNFINELSSLFKSYNKIALDVGKVAEIDTAGLQTMIAAKKEALLNNKVFKIVNHSPSVIRLIDLLGLVGFFGDKIKIPTEDRNKYSLKYGIKKQNVLPSLNMDEL